MSQRFLGSVAAIALLTGVSVTMPVLAETVAAPAPSPAAKPMFGDWGVDLTGMDTSIKPGDDFYDFVNGAWAKRTEIPADKSSWGGFGILRYL